ncbi:MAG: glycosyltransferase family 4 protein, partial [Acidobacteria bacterium]|nr:glycosyltransferase family 4 protein [Acidobacteriota bacterium]
AGLLAAHLLGKPVVMSTAALGVINGNNIAPVLTRLGITADGTLARAIKWPIRALYSSGEAYAAITHAIAHEAIAAGVPAHRVHYLPNSVDTRVFHPADAEERLRLRATFGMRDDEVACLFLARLSQEKGLMDLMAAWPTVAAPNARLFVVGPDMTGHPMDVGPAARAFVAANGLADRIVFAGPTTAASEWLRAADLLIQPSHWEGAPFGIIEAMATGLPIVATRVGGMAEVLTEGVTALLCDPRDPQALASAISRLIADPDLRAAMRLASRQLAVREFDETVICSRYAALFEGLAAAAAQ